MKSKLTLATICATALTACSEHPQNAKIVDTEPAIWPDYAGVTIPQGVAPLNFAMADDAALVEAKVSAPSGKSTTACGDEANFDIDQWRTILSECKGGDSLIVTVSAKYADGWRTFRPFSIYVSGDSLSATGLTYRRIAPGYEVYSKMGIYYRDLSTFKETVIMENTEVPNSCVNCHTARRGTSGDFMFHVRGANGGTLLSTNGKLEILNTPTPQTIGALTYPAWHPDGRHIAFSANTTRQSFHQGSDKRLEVFDVASDIVVYDTELNKLIITPLLNNTDSCWETFPYFSADGGELYYCSTTPRQMPSEVRDVRYSLRKVAFDAARGVIGDSLVNVLTLDSLSISFPRTSPDGRFLMFTACDYGTFPIWHREADLWLLDLGSGEARPMDEINSGEAESFHEWSTNSRWVIFSSRRGDGLYTRLYLCHVDTAGRASKPFLLPQISPKEYYDEMMQSYNVPSFADTKVELDAKGAANRLTSGKRVQVMCE